MDWYYYIAWAAILSQLVFLAQIYRNYRYVLAKYEKKRPLYRPKTALFIPCKGLDPAFQKNITSFFAFLQNIIFHLPDSLQNKQDIQLHIKQ